MFSKKKLTKKEEKDSGKTKSADFPPADLSIRKFTYQSQANQSQKNNQDHQQDSWHCGKRWYGHDSPITSVIARSVKKEVKDLS